MKWWLPLCLSNQQCSTFNMVLSHVWPQKDAAYFSESLQCQLSWEPEQGTASFRSVSRIWKGGGEVHRLSALLRWRRERGTTCQLLPMTPAQVASAFPFPPFTGHEHAKGAGRVTDRLQSNAAEPAHF